MIIKIKKNNKGFIILFAVTISTILLAITLGVANIALKEINFSTSARDTNEAFFAADTGIECALFNDKSGGNSFLETGGSGSVQCRGSSINFLPGSAWPSWSFVVSGLGNMGYSCAIVTVEKDNSAFPAVTTTIIAKGFSSGDADCDPTSSNRIERELSATYTTGSSLAFITSKNPGTLRNNHSGCVGAKFTVGSVPVTVTSLGRLMVLGNDEDHTVRLIQVSDDVTVGSAVVNMVGGTNGQFKYEPLSSPITLTPSTSYYLVSEEVIGGDEWYDFDTVVSTGSVASIDSAVWSFGCSGGWNETGGSTNMFVPVDFIYQ